MLTSIVFLDKFMIIALMLSFPKNLFSHSYSLQINISNILSTIAASFYFLFILVYTYYSTHSPGFYSHTPSQANINSWTSSLCILMTSGTHITICYLCEIFLFYLNYKSPIARDTFKVPHILPYPSTYPPAFRIRLCSD